MLLSQAGSSALSYDARLIPRDLLEREAKELGDSIRQTAAMMFGISANEQANQRMRLVGAL